MDELYKYEAEQFGISEKSVHLLRNRFNYKTIDFNQIDSITIKKGKTMKNWLFVLVFGLSLLAFALYDLFQIYLVFFDNSTSTIYIERLLIPLFPFIIGIYAIIISIKTSDIILIKVDSKNYYFSLSKIMKSDNYEGFKILIKELFPKAEIQL